MDLDARKIKILQAIIKNYLDTAEPVGSRTISRRYDLGVSSATIRNEMSDLEELGFIVQPHTSAGRVPSDKGYRLYVDHLMQNDQLSQEQSEIIKKLLLSRVNRLDNLLMEISDLLAIATSYTSIVTTPMYTKIKIKQMQLIPLDTNQIILVVVTNGNIVKNNLINIDRPIEADRLSHLSNMLNAYLQGMTTSEITLPMIQEIKTRMGVHGEILHDVLDAITEALKQADDYDIYTSGTTNILSFPEFNNVLKAKNLIKLLEEKDAVKTVFDFDDHGQEQAIRVSIGEENNIAELKDCSLITTTYTIGGETVGSIGIIGPTRMDYGKVVSTLKYLIKEINPLLEVKFHKKE